MWSSITALFLLSSLGGGPSAASPEVHWLNCSVLESPRGRIIVDRLAYVFFDKGSAAITPEARGILDSFIDQYDQPVQSPKCRVTIGGSTDRDELPDHDVHLSSRRAHAVADYLRSKGLTVPLSIEDYGATRPLVETPAGMSERQNRYVVVVVGQQ